MPSKEELRAQLQKQLDELDNEPAGPPPNTSFVVDLSNDNAFERAKKLGIFGKAFDEPAPEDTPKDPPKRGGGGFLRGDD